MTDTCDVCGEEQKALIHTDTELHPDDALDGLTLHAFVSVREASAGRSFHRPPRGAAMRARTAAPWERS